MKKMISLNNFKEYKGLLEDNITNRAFRSRMMFEAIEDENFSKEIIKYILKLNDKISSNEIDNILLEIRNQTDKYYKLSKSTSDDDKKIMFGLRSLAYFYFLESIDEHSLLSEKIVEDIKNKYPKDYLELISKIDKIYLSVDTKQKIKEKENDLVIEDDLLNKYIILKQWQDKQHHYFDEEYGKYLEEIQYEYTKDKSLDSFNLEQVSLRKRLFDSLDKEKILDLDTCSILSELYIKKFIIKYIGGKMYGLSVLNSKGIKVPYSMVVPTGVVISADDLKRISKKYSRFSVRSSADIEDGEKNSFAGMFDSYLNVSFNDILENINKVKNSVNNDRLKEYIQVNHLEEPHMAVVIQSFKEPNYAGVWIGNSENSGILEWVKGNGEKLVSGSSTPTSEIWNNGNTDNQLQLNNESIGSKMLEYQKKVGSNADFEWMILDNELVMLQFRPVTQQIIVDNNYSNEEIDGFSGIPASPGTIEGQAKYLDSPSDEMQVGKILLAMMTDPDWLPHLMNSKGAITAYGGFLCHTAIVCRELGIPCVTGVGEDAVDELSKNITSEIQLNGSNGKVKILKK